MKVTSLIIHDAFLIKPQIFHHDRVLFFESFNQELFEEAIARNINFVQDNNSKSHKGGLRGLHYKISAKAQRKLVYLTQSEVFDVVVDLRKSFPTFGKWV